MKPVPDEAVADTTTAGFTVVGSIGGRLENVEGTCVIVFGTCVIVLGSGVLMVGGIGGIG
jgi:hypothetical protein